MWSHCRLLDTLSPFATELSRSTVHIDDRPKLQKLAEYIRRQTESFSLGNVTCLW